jgi:LmbE family N-acetylglucosaminyl deacetylase
MKKFNLLVFCCLLLTTVKAQNYTTSADIYLGLKKLNVLGSVLYIAAHPDDENTRLITYFSKDRLYRTGYLSLTRGDGGQNLIGNEQGIELGLIRTQELLSARRIDGGEQFFTRAFDFGYSKTPEETFTKWDREKILSDVVWVIRKFQPDVIITRFPTTGEGGHGHHTASAILANEAFTAAADPKRFPEQLKYVKAWQPKRIVWNGFNFNNATPPPGVMKLDVGGYNPVLGKSYGEIAAESRSQHKSQGFGSSGNRGEAFEWFRPTGGKEAQQDLFEDVETGWKKINASAISKLVDSITNAFDFLHPEYSVKSLVHLYKVVKALPASVWQSKKLAEISQLIEACSGLFADATTAVPYVAQTDSVRMNFTLNNRLGADMIFQGLSFEGFDTVNKKKLDKNTNLNLPFTIYIPPTKSITQPYWLEHDMKEGYYNVEDQQLIGQPDVTSAFIAIFDVKINGEDFRIRRNVRYRYNDPVKGEVYQPFIVVPPYSLHLSPEINIGSSSFEKSFTSFRNNNKVVMSRQLDKKKTDSLVLSKNQVVIKQDSISFADLSSNLKKNETSQEYDLSTGFYDLQNQRPVMDMNTILYDHIPAIRYFQESKIRFRKFGIKTAGKKIGYIVGAGDKVPEALDLMGYEVTVLTDKELSRNHLDQFDAIITGVRAYNTNEWLNNYYDKLMNYVKNGGNLIVQYNTSNNIGPVRARIGPYDFDISRTRITDENAPVNFLLPEHPVLNFPNKISQEDFKGWVQERSVYHAAKYDSSFQAVLNMSDPAEKPENGSLIIAPYGRGYFTYTGLVFFRELPAGVPGAYRLLANLIALNRKKEF